MQGSKGTGGFVEGGFASQFEEQPPSSPGWPSDPDAHASVLAVPAGQRVPSAAGEGGQEGWASAGAAGQQAVQVPAAVTAGMQQQQRSAGPSRPGAAVCQMFMIRGFCPHGERCVYDHPTRSGTQVVVAGWLDDDLETLFMSLDHDKDKFMVGTMLPVAALIGTVWPSPPHNDKHHRRVAQVEGTAPGWFCCLLCMNV